MLRSLKFFAPDWDKTWEIYLSLSTTPAPHTLYAQVDPENYLGYSPHSPLDPGGDVSLGQSWAQTQAMVSPDPR